MYEFVCIGDVLCTNVLDRTHALISQRRICSVRTQTWTCMQSYMHEVGKDEVKRGVGARAPNLSYGQLMRLATKLFLHMPMPSLCLSPLHDSNRDTSSKKKACGGWRRPCPNSTFPS